MQTKNPLWYIFPIALAVAFLFYFQFNILNNTRSQLVDSQTLVQYYEKRDVEDLSRFNEARQKIQTLETSGAENIRKLQAAQQKIKELERTIMRNSQKIFAAQDLEKTGAENNQQLNGSQQEMRTIPAVIPPVDAFTPRMGQDFAALKVQVDALVKKQDTAIAALKEANEKLQDSLNKGLVDHERFDNILAMTDIPMEVRIAFTYSLTLAAKLDALEGDSPEVIQYIRKYKLIPPPQPVYLTQLPPSDTSKNISPLLFNIYKNKTNGFYVEYGAFDGLSNTFFAEKSLNWSGVLIEAEPNNFAQVLQKKRNAYLVPACLSLSTKTKLSGFRFGHHVYAHIDTTNKLHSVQVHCLPLYSILLALNRTTVDLFSLDIEGYELDVLKTIPFDKVDIAALIVKFSPIKKGKKTLEDFMASRGYTFYPTTTEERKIKNWASDEYIFIKKKLIKRSPVLKPARSSSRASYLKTNFFVESDRKLQKLQL